MAIGVSVSSVMSGTPSYRPASAPKSGAQSFSQSFSGAMDDAQRREFRKRAEALFKKITDSAADIMKTADLDKFEEYRREISLIMSDILEHAYLFNEEKAVDGNGRRRIYATITVIDEKLKKLASDLMDRNGDIINFMSRVDEMRGLLLDLLT